LTVNQPIGLPKRQVHWKRLGVLLAVTAVVVALWDTWAVYPLKILVVFFHELSHGLAAMATGGRIVEVQVDAAHRAGCV
jgi:hypothetical protein